MLRAGALKPENKPIWYEIYQHFPPKFAPRVDRPVPNIEVTPIFYPEDALRSKLVKEKSPIIGVTNLQDGSRPTNSQKCIAYYEELKQECSTDEEALKRAVERVASEIPTRRDNPESEPLSITEEFKRAKHGIKIADILKNE